MQVERQHGTSVLMASGARVSNAYTTYLKDRDSPGKLGLIPDVVIDPPGFIIKGLIALRWVCVLLASW